MLFILGTQPLVTSLVWEHARWLTSGLFGTGHQQCGESVYLARGPGRRGGKRLPNEGTLVDKAVITTIKTFTGSKASVSK